MNGLNGQKEDRKRERGEGKDKKRGEKRKGEERRGKRRFTK